MGRGLKRRSIAAMFRQRTKHSTIETQQIKRPPPTCLTDEARHLHYQAEVETAFEDTLQNHIDHLHENISSSKENNTQSLSQRLRRLEDANRMLTRPMLSEKLRIYKDGDESVDTTLQAEFDEFRKIIDVEETELRGLFQDLDEVNNEIAKAISGIELELARTEATEQSRNVKQVQAIEKQISELGQVEIERLEGEETKRRRKQRVIFETLTELAE